MAKDTEHCLRVKVIKKEGWLLGMALSLMVKLQLVGSDMICINTQLLIKTLPLPSYVNVKNLTNGKSVIVKVNDRGPFVDNRIIDLSYAAAKKIDMLSEGTAFVRVSSVSEEEAARSIKKNNQSIFSTNIFEKIVSRNKNKILIQIGAFNEEKGAKELKKRVANIGVKSVYIIRARSGREIFYRVRVGPITNVESYEDTIKKLTSLKLDINLISQ